MRVNAGIVALFEQANHSLLAFKKRLSPETHLALSPGARDLIDP